MPFKKKKKKEGTDDKLDQILHHLAAMDKRDRLRTWGGFIKGIIGLVPAIVFIWGMWYFYQHGDDIMAKIAKTAAEQSSEGTKQGTEGLIVQIKNFQVR